MIIKLLKPLNHYASGLFSAVRPVPKNPPPIGQPSPEVLTATARFERPEGTIMTVEKDLEQQALEENKDRHWFTTAEYPAGFCVERSAYQVLEP